MSCSKSLGSKKCKRKCSGSFPYCWQHTPSPKPSTANRPDSKSNRVTPTKSASSKHGSVSPKSKTPKSQSPRKKSPKKSGDSEKERLLEKASPVSPRKVSFSKKIHVRYIPRRNVEEPGGIAWAEEVSDLQGICVSSVLDVYSTWDRDTFEKRSYETKTENLIDSCLRVMENKKITIEEELEIMKFCQKRENARKEYIRERIRGYEVF